MRLIALRRWLPIGAFVSLGFAAACADRPPQNATSSDQRIALDDSVLATLPVWNVAPQPSLVIGRANGADADLFTMPFYATRLPDSSLVVGELTDHSFRVFDRNGSFVRRFGRSGGGPGEFRSWQVFSSAVNGKFAVFDPELRRITYVDGATGSMKVAPATDQCRMQIPEHFCDVIGITPSGVPVTAYATIPAQVHGSGFVIKPGVSKYFAVSRGSKTAVLDSGTSVAMVVKANTVGSNQYYNVNAPFAPESFTAIDDSTIVVCNSGEDDLRLYDPEGRRPPSTIALSASEKVTTPAMLDEMVDSAGAKSRTVIKPFVETLKPGQRIPFWSDLRLDTRGRLWLKMYALPTTYEHRNTDWLVLERSGKPVARVKGLTGLILEIGDDYVITTSEDADGIATIALSPILTSGR